MCQTRSSAHSEYMTAYISRLRDLRGYPSVPVVNRCHQTRFTFPDFLFLYRLEQRHSPALPV